MNVKLGKKELDKANQEMRQELAEVKEGRLKRRRDFFTLAQVAHENKAKARGSFEQGRDEHGNTRSTKRLSDLGMEVSPDYLTTTVYFSYEDASRLKKMNWKRVEELEKSRALPYKKVPHQSHTFTAVRKFKHVPKSYYREIAQADKLLSSLDQLNLKLASPHSEKTEQLIAQAIEALSAAKKFFEAKRIALKKVVAAARTQETIKLLEAERQNISAACAVLVSVRERLGKWREKRIAGITQTNLERQWLLRVFRDKALLSLLHKFAQDTQKVSNFSKSGQKRAQNLQEVEKMLDSKTHGTAKVLSFMEKHHPLFMSKEGSSYLLQKYGEIYLEVKKGNSQEAKRKLKSLKFYLTKDKPHFIYSELSKTQDTYLGKVLSHFKSALVCLDEGKISEASSKFSKAAAELESILSPSAASSPKAT